MLRRSTPFLLSLSLATGRSITTELSSSFVHRNEFALEVNQAGAAHNWHDTVAIMANILPEELSRLARQNPPNCASHFADLIEVDENWFTSVFVGRMRVVVAFLHIKGTGEGQTDKVFDPYGNEVIHPIEKEEYLRDSASIEIAKWICARHPDIDIRGVT
ncbi:hypothetical protein PanWU01x14_296110 [Parasponia andersonii]|uniref:Uncharacterized protein n=1 Tax=Parasponia andersonii TaxID=3476 RepID=A0A2P5AVN1_PARAD|nr:hypothetical protein PanWU01x14_296110 [Parasponia andersonii]